MPNEIDPAFPAAAPPREVEHPLTEPERLSALDILRGVAVLGIFVMNSRNFALPLQQFDNPAFPGRPGTAEAADLWAWGAANILFEDKMIAIFSLLFGAGIVIAAGRAARPLLIHYRRMFWLLVIGLLHAYGLWYGDILNTYAILGAAVYPLRRLRPALLIAFGVVVLMVAIGARLGPQAGEMLWPKDAPEAAAPAEPSRSDRIWSESIRGEEAAYRGSYLDLARWRARLNEVWHWHGGYRFNFWRCGGFILIGMGLVQLGILSAARPASFYWALLIGGYAVGLTLILAGFWPQLARALGRAPELSPGARTLVGGASWALRYTGAGAMALGHIALVMLLCRARTLAPVLRPLGAAGRMALTNYLLQTVIAVLVFDGWALGLWGRWRMSQVALLVLGVWVFQLIASPLWFRWFRFGPAEWAWRSLTYWRAQPLVRTP